MRTNKQKMPALFIGHGSPMNVVSKNDFTESLAALGKKLPEPRAIMVISAHWLTPGTNVTCSEKPRTIHDFYGFPQELYEIEYPCPGAPDVAKYLIGSARKVTIKCNNDWGLDHASWAVLKHMYPAADIPVFEMSLDYSFNEWHPKPMQYHYDIAQELATLREKGILIIGSGNIVHNLGLIDFRNIDAQPYDWAVEFDERVKLDIARRDHAELINFQKINGAAMAVPTLDHYLPMIYVLALREKNDPLKFTYEGFQHGSISMRCFQIG
ncbi:Catalytic LigB subunit of aromatic ring-opening dioxygenase [uncultured archaeon]|nr:Catalytic LigB subunit of aromatic ring-opening dioxygenase [uncultured archaeon]